MKNRRRRTAIKIPPGYEEVKTGKLQRGDQYYLRREQKFIPVYREDVGGDVADRYLVIRRMTDSQILKTL